MCGMCSDYVASCWVCTQPMRGGKGTMGKQFFLEFGDRGKFCEHFIERYHTDSPSMYSHVEREHSEEDEEYNEYWSYHCEDNCVAEGWYTQEQLKYVVDAFNQWGAV